MRIHGQLGIILARFSFIAILGLVSCSGGGGGSSAPTAGAGTGAAWQPVL